MKRFRKVYVEITNICNMNCSFCPRTKRAKAIMSLKEFEYIADQIKPYTDYVYLHVKGEPLIHPELESILEICKKYGFKVNISTNGMLLESKVEILKEIRQLNVSLHSFEEENEEKLDTYLDSVLQASEALAENGVIVRYKLWNDKTGKNNFKIIQILENRYNKEIFKSSYDKDIKLMANIFLSIKQPFEWPNMLDKDKVETTCYGLRKQVAILVDGAVVPCCVDNDGDINLGNIFEKSLQEILETDMATKIKEGFENNKCIHSLCKKCSYRIGVT